MPVYETRRLRNLAAALMLLSGLTHSAQLWLTELGATAVTSALVGLFYLLVALGLSGQSRFSLWAGLLVPITGSLATAGQWADASSQALPAWHLLVDILVIGLCAYVLFRTRHELMD